MPITFRELEDSTTFKEDRVEQDLEFRTRLDTAIKTLEDSIVPRIVDRVSSIADLKTLIDPYEGKLVIVSGPLGGMFQWVGGDKRSLVNLDTLQGLYVPPNSGTDGLFGVWTRIVKDNKYYMEWFGASTTRNDNEVVLNAMGKKGLLPLYAMLKGVGDFGVSGPIFLNQTIIIDGEYKLGLIDKTGSGLYDLINLRGSFSVLTRCRLKGPLVKQFANEPHVVVLGWGGYTTTDVAARTVVGITVEDNDIDGETGIQEAPYIALQPGAVPTGKDGSYLRQDNPLIPIFDSRINNNRIYARKHGIGCYGSTGTRCWDNQIRMEERLEFDASSFISFIRVLGAKDLVCYNNEGKHPTEVRRGVQNFGFFVAQANYNLGRIWLSNENIILKSNITINCCTHYAIGGVNPSSVHIDSPIIVGGLTSTADTCMFDLAQGPKDGWAHVYITNVHARGCSTIFTGNASVKRLVIKNVDWIANLAPEQPNHIRMINQTDTSYYTSGIGSIEISKVRALRGGVPMNVGFDIIGNGKTFVSILDCEFDADSLPNGGARAISISTFTLDAGGQWTTDGNWNPLTSNGFKPLGRNYILPSGLRSISA